MAKNLVIVESPAKAKTIEGILGKDYVVKSSYGHVRDLDEKELSVDIQNQFKPIYKVMPDKKAVIAELKKLVKDAEIVWLATDEDREGEAISWHLFETLDLQEDKTKRIVFHEITKPAIEKAVQNPRTINKNLVDAQQARRVLDRLVGYELSPVLWKKVKPSLSAGRVQSVSVRLIVEREREINNFNSEVYFKTQAFFIHSNGKFKAELNEKLKTKNAVINLLNALKGNKFQIQSIEVKPGKKSPAAPFTTSTLQQEAARKLGFSVSQTMSIAQKLYEAGKITYMRTDSMNLSDLAIGTIKAEVSSQFGEQYFQYRQFKTKIKGAQEAHEAIRPTYISNHTIEGDAREKKLYDLIWKRTIASLMADAETEKTTVKINTENHNAEFIASGEVIKFDGFLKVYLESTDDETENEDETLLPKMNKGDGLNLDRVEVNEKFTHHPARYSEASLVKKLEELGIGRPSTYAPTISTIIKRGYVVKDSKEGIERNYINVVLKDNEIIEKIKKEKTGTEKNKLFPTDIGYVVNDFLVNNFIDVLDFNFTAQVEKEFDDIADGEENWIKMIERFYRSFHPHIEKTLIESEKARGEKVLGIDEKSGKQISVKIGRYGAYVQKGEATETEKPLFASLQPGQSIESISLKEALKLFDLPRTLKTSDGVDLIINNGKFGPYIQMNKKFYSLPKGTDLFKITLEEALGVVKLKNEAEEKAEIASFQAGKILILNGRYGPYIKSGKNNFKIPKDRKPESLTEQDCLEIINAAPSPAISSAKKSKK
jgi:DNA topoisomerase-1